MLVVFTIALSSPWSTRALREVVSLAALASGAGASLGHDPERSVREHAPVYRSRLFQFREEGCRTPFASRRASAGLAEKFEEILVPTEQVVEIAAGARSTRSGSSSPATSLVKCDLTDEVYHLIKNTPKVTGFLGAELGVPMPIPTQRPTGSGRVADGVDNSRKRRSGSRSAKTSGRGRAVRIVQRDCRGSRRIPARGSRSPCRSLAGATPVDLEFGQVEKV